MQKVLPSIKKSILKNKPINIILLGDPAAGKATQSALLIKKFKLYDLDMGKELRKRKALNAKFNKQLKNTYDKGRLTQTAFVRKILHDKIRQTPNGKGILFDGTPKMAGEARLVAKWLKLGKRKDPLVIYLSIPLKETIKRMSNRIEYFKGKFSKRTDDSNAALKNRVAYYRLNIAQVVAFFKTKYSFKKINGMGDTEAVHKRIMEAIKQYQKENS